MNPLPVTFCALLLVAAAAPAQETTSLGEGAGKYGELFDRLASHMADNLGELSPKKLRKEEVYDRRRPYEIVNFAGRERIAFCRWIRDHVHCLKAYRYFEPDLTSYLDVYLENQTDEGIFFDFLFPLDYHKSFQLNLLDNRFWKIDVRNHVQFTRVPVEADVEYLIVEGVHNAWQATGDLEHVRANIGRLERGMKYAMSDPLRWSTKHRLVKRGYTIDTWDFMNPRPEVAERDGHVINEELNISLPKPMGVMHGDNSGMYAACRQLAKMYEALGNPVKAAEWSHEAELFRLRTNALCWNGRFYAHFVADDPFPDHYEADHENLLSLSNAYNINRGLPTEEMAQSIIQTYLELKESVRGESFAEWFALYPPIEPAFKVYKPGEYMNGGITTVVAGELAKAAFNHGYEAYGVDILDRLIDLMERYDGELPCVLLPSGEEFRGIPDIWGQTAILDAMVEGLAGVVDKDRLFRHAEVSPRWLAAGRDEADVNVRYAASGAAVRYSYRRDASAGTITLDFSGDPERYTLRLMLPEGETVAEARLDGAPAEFAIGEVRQTRYAVVAADRDHHSLELKLRQR